LSTPLDNIREEAERILRAADARALTLRLLGGMAYKLLSPSSREGPLSRPYPNDLDFAGYARESTALKALFQELGYLPNKRFNALHGRTRLQFIDEVHGRVFDIFLDVFRMCHSLSLKQRLKLFSPTIPPSDLLLTKLQIVRLNEKDVKDALALLKDLELGESDTQTTIDVNHISALCSKDWGLYKTVSTNLAKLADAADGFALAEGEREKLKSKIRSILARLEAAPKGVRWRLRALLGERLPWYELPEAPVRLPGQKYETQR
jgi:hypothetical protein